MKPRTRVLLMLKAPLLGTVKTRLANEIGYDKALVIYRKLVEKQILEIPNNSDLHVHFTPAHEELLMRQWLGELTNNRPIIYHPQPEGDLGHRMSYAMEHAFMISSAPILFLGGDCPYLTMPILNEAIDRLSLYDVVVGPSSDGGYVYIGFRTFLPKVLEKISWSTNLVFVQTMERIREHGLTCKVGETLEDVDDLASCSRAAHLLFEP